VGNKCNLRCRVCNATSSSTYAIEGKYYKEKNNLSEKTFYTNADLKPVEFTESQIDEIFQISKNVKRIEFYGGEPLLDAPTLSLLEKLVNTGQSKDISLFYNTNGVCPAKRRHTDLWGNFHAIEFNLSIDDIGERFTYNRHPASWEDLLTNIENLRTYNWSIPAKFYTICTVSNLNIFYIPEILTELKKLELPCFLNVLDVPEYYNISYLPNGIKNSIIKKLEKYEFINEIQFLVNVLRRDEDLNSWEQFKFWTREKDLYRKENFKQTYPEFYKVIKEYDEQI
jgi:MoaA/NifB/PqqE/SkfB family radical SAM enzyme